jgi:hypothetical protein
LPFFGYQMRSKGCRETRMKRLLVATMALAVTATAAMAQGRGHGGGGAAAPADDKKEQATRKVNDAAYKAALERIPDPKQKYDPWGSVVQPEPAKKPK